MAVRAAANYQNVQLRHLGYKLWRSLNTELDSLGCNIVAKHHVAVHELLGLPNFRGFKVQDVEQVVQQNYKDGRPCFSLYRDEFTGIVYIRANTQQVETVPPAAMTIQRKKEQLRQPVDYLCILDFECTCDQGVQPMPQEIIEFPVVLLNTRTLKVEDTFHYYVRPVIHPRLSGFCKQLTGIQQSSVNASPPLWDVLAQFDNWLRVHNLSRAPRHRRAAALSPHSVDGSADSDSDSSIDSKTPTVVGSPPTWGSKPHSATDLLEDVPEEDGSSGCGPQSPAKQAHSFSMVSDGPYDIRDFLMPNSEAVQIPLLDLYPYWDRWVNLRQTFASHFGCRRMGIKDSLDLIGLTFQGRPHAGMDDARNLATLATHLVQHGAVLKDNCFLSKRPGVA